jgi:hypothetical protein
MSEIVFWNYNGWAILITLLGPLYTIAQAESRMYRFLLRKWIPVFWLISLTLLFFLSGWIPVLLYFPCWIGGVILFSIVKHRGLG